MRKRNVIFNIVLFLMIVTLVFIFSNSLLPSSESSEKSEDVMYNLKPLFEMILGQGNVTDHIVRKTAHFTEFAVLGIELMLLSVLRRRRLQFQNFLNCLFAGLATAVTDESLQLLSDRGPLVQDILLDFCGALTGILLILLLRLIFGRRRSHY